MSDNESRPLSGWTVWLIGIIAFIAGGFCFIYADGFIHRDSGINPAPPKAKDYPYFTDVDKKLSDTVNPVSDRELLRELWHNQRHIHNMQADLLADVRQETNNSLEKITSELNFWIAVLALIGVFVPIAITYKGERDYKIRLEENIKNSKDRIASYIGRLNLRISKWNERLVRNEEEYKKLSEKLTESQKAYHELHRQLDLEIDVCTLSSVHNNRFLENDRQTETAYRQLSDRTIRKFLRIFEETISDGNKIKDDDSKWSLTQMCMLYYDMLRNLTLDHSGPTRPRYLYAAEENIKRLIQELMKEIPDIGTVRNIFKDVKTTYYIALERMKSSF